MYLNATDKAVLVELIGTSDLDDTNPVDQFVYLVAHEYGHHQANIREYAQLIARNLLRVANGAERNPTTLASSSDPARYDAAVASRDALREPLAAARSAYRQAHNIGD